MKKLFFFFTIFMAAGFSPVWDLPVLSSEAYGQEAELVQEGSVESDFVQGPGSSQVETDSQMEAYRLDTAGVSPYPSGMNKSPLYTFSSSSNSVDANRVKDADKGTAWRATTNSPVWIKGATTANPQLIRKFRLHMPTGANWNDYQRFDLWYTADGGTWKVLRRYAAPSYAQFSNCTATHWGACSLEIIVSDNVNAVIPVKAFEIDVFEHRDGNWVLQPATFSEIELLNQ